MRTNFSTKTFWVTLLACLSYQVNAQTQSPKQLSNGELYLENGASYLLPTTETEHNDKILSSDNIYYLHDFFQKTDQSYLFLGKTGTYAIHVYKKTNGYQEKDGPIKNYYMQIWPKDGATNEDEYSCLEKNFGAIWVSGIKDGLPNYKNYSSDWDAWDTFAMAETAPKVYEMTLTLGQELGSDAQVKFWFHNFSQSRYRRDDGRAVYGIPDGGNWDKVSHAYEFRGNKWKDDFAPLLKMENCDFMEVSKHTKDHDASGGDAAQPQYGNGNMGGIAVGDYSDLPKLPSSTSKHTYKYKFTINLQGVNDIKQDHKEEQDFAYGITIENKGDKYGLENYDVNSFDNLTLDTEDNNGKHAISLRDAMRFQGGVLYKDHFAKKFKKLVITGYLNQSQDIAFLRDIANNVKVLDLSGVTGIEGNQIPEGFSANNNTLEELILPASLQTIGAKAFANCPNLKKVYVKGYNAATGADASAFSNINANQCELVFENDADGNQYRNGGWMNILTKDIYENADREEAKKYNVCHQAHADVRLHRQFTGKWETIVLPFDVDKKQIKTKEGSIDHASYFYGYQGNATSGNISFVNVHHESTKYQGYTFKAGSPFLLRFINNYTSPANDSLTFENVETYAFDKLPSLKDQSITKNGLTFVGTFDATPKDKDKKADIFALKNGQFYHATNASMKGYRAWFEKTTTTQNAKTLTFTEVDGDNNTTAIIGIGNDGSFTEAFDIYNINGQLVQKDATSTDGLPKGIYIVNHKKIVVK